MEVYDFKGKVLDTIQSKALIRIMARLPTQLVWMHNPRLTLTKASVPDTSYARVSSCFPRSSHTQLFSLKDAS